ncbi:hypothetical protein MKW98_010622 [Papaver atlanticum]|uniref:FACT complex subunit n=1 Tax=Papaver atlanticum TaxID=357466 RepID=A0AAD4X6P1_9MAGN|nr:hypothetical protein MKW98_010622 [Papaver atlanticum]
MSDEVDYERIARESIAYRRSPTQEQKDRDMRVFGKIRDRKPYNFESFSKRLKYQNRHSPAALWNEISISDDKERYLEELRRQHQAKLSRRLHRETAKRLGVTMPVDDRSDLITSVTAATKNNQHLQLSRNSMQLRVSIHPYTVRGHHRKLEMGTLQAHANGFRFSNYSIPLLMDVMYDNIKHAFYQDGDERMAPFLHLNLHNPIMLGTETTKDIQFRLVQTSAGSRRKGPLARDSDKLDKERQETVDNQMNKLASQFFMGSIGFK